MTQASLTSPGFRRVAPHSHTAFFVLGRVRTTLLVAVSTLTIFEVFKMLWTEPAGLANPGKSRNSTHFSLVWLNEHAYSEIRHFVVVRNKGTFSQCM